MTDSRMINYADQDLSINHYVSMNADSKGMNLLVINNGLLEITFQVDHALDIYQIKYLGKNISFISKMGLNNKDTKPFSNRFEGGSLYTCGIDNIGNREGYTQHGLFHLINAKMVSEEITEEGIKIVGEVRQTSFFSHEYIMRRTFILSKDKAHLKIHDELTNLGEEKAPYVLLYHMNFGYPFMDDKAQIEINHNSMRGVTPFAELHKNEFTSFGEPNQKEEQVIYHFNNDGEVKVKSANLKCQARINYDHNVFPYFIEWKALMAHDYALGMEPSTSLFGEEFKYQYLEPHEVKKINIELEITPTK